MQSRVEDILLAIINGTSSSELPAPQSRTEVILQAILDGIDSSELPPPQSRNEALLMRVLDKINEGGGGSDGVYVGTGAPDASIGSNGDYYYQRANKGEFGYTSTPAQDSGTSQTGYEFIANEAIEISGLRAYNTNISGTISLLLAQLDGTILGQIDNVPVTGDWATAYFDTPIQLTAGEHYIVQAIRNGGTGFRYRSKSSTVFNSKITGVQGRYGSLPGTTDASNIYSADIIIASGSNIYIVTKQYYKSSGAWGGDRVSKNIVIQEGGKGYPLYC